MKNLNNWHDIPWKLFHKQVMKTQYLIVMANKQNNLKQVYHLQRQLVVSLAARAVAIRRVVTNSGSSTPGVDKQVWDSPAKRLLALLELKQIVHTPTRYAASPLKRVWLPKPNSDEKRPLGIPTMIDRAVQAVYHMAIDPVVEASSDPNSYGFRSQRSTHDAVTRLRTLLDKKTSPTWILDADVAKCFDTISHDFLLKQTVICDKGVLEQWLKCGVLEGGVIKATDAGTPQGGILSPMLCNVALNGLEDAALSSFPRIKAMGRPKIHLTRYADDFVCTGLSQSLLEEIVKPAIGQFLLERGLEFKQSKTSIVHIDQGFDFLGFHFKRNAWNYKLNLSKKNTDSPKHVLIIKPSDASVMELKDSIRKIIKPTRPIESIIRDVNPVLRGWSEYSRISYHSLPVFWSLGHSIWGKMWRWARKRHPKRRASWVLERYILKKQIASGVCSLSASLVIAGETQTKARSWIFVPPEREPQLFRRPLFDICSVTH
jgi:RNA-directed DNA polymerase